jgi:hypothetical protein
MNSGIAPRRESGCIGGFRGAPSSEFPLSWCENIREKEKHVQNQEHRRPLEVCLDRNAVRQLVHTAQQHDIETGGLYDARSGCINVWCSPEDKPNCWDIAVEAGGLDFPRSYVGSLEWEWNENAEDNAALYVEATPYDLLDRQNE